MVYVDGHNTLHTVPELRELMQRSIVTAMQRLIGRVKQIPGAIVVFDGNPPSPFTNTDSNVVFANAADHKYERADNYILNKIRTGSQANVVTRDSALAGTLRQLGVTVIDPVEWFGTAGKTTAPKSHHTLNRTIQEQKHGPGGTKEEWVKLFKRGVDEENEE